MDQPASRRHRSKRPGVQAHTPKSHHQVPSPVLFTRDQHISFPPPPPPPPPPYPPHTNDTTPQSSSKFSGSAGSSTYRPKQSYVQQPMATAAAAPLSPGTPGLPSVSSRERLHRRQRSHPFLNLTFTALHEPSPPQNGPQRQPSQPVRSNNATGSHPNTGFGPSALVTGSTTSQEGDTRTRSTTNTTSSAHFDTGFSSKKRPARSLPSSPGPTRRPSLSQPSSPLNGLDPRKEYFFTPSSTPVVLPPVDGAMTPRMRKRSTGAKSAPTSPVCSLTPVGSQVNLVAYAEKSRLARSGSIGEAMHALRNQQQQQQQHWVGQSPRTEGFPAGGNFFASRPQYHPNADGRGRFATSPDEEISDEAEVVSFAGRRDGERKLRRSRSSTAPAGSALEDIRVDATPALSRRQSEVTLRAHSVQVTSPPEGFIDAVPLPATMPTEHLNEIDQKTISILYALRYLAVIPVLQTAVSNFRLTLFAKYSAERTQHGLVSLWAIVAAFALVNLTTDLLRRWIHSCRYPPFPHILIRLLALQLGILFPLIHLGLALLAPKPASSRQTVVAWCFLASVITLVGTLRPWTRVTLGGDAAEGEQRISEKEGQSTLAGDEQSHGLSRHHFGGLRKVVSDSLFPISLAYFATTWALLLAEATSKPDS